MGNVMFKRAYRLGEYRITEYENGLLQCERLFNFGVQRSGKCLICGDVLIIGHWSHEELGYLQLEFHEQLERLPPWNRTRYYCFAFELLSISNRQTATSDYLEARLRSIDSASLKSEINVSTGTFRLGRYQITVDDNGEVSWQTHGGLNRVVGGRCVFESGILFMDEQEYDDAIQSKRDFLRKLNELSKCKGNLSCSNTCRLYLRQKFRADSSLLCGGVAFANICPNAKIWPYTLSRNHISPVR